MKRIVLLLSLVLITNWAAAQRLGGAPMAHVKGRTIEGSLPKPSYSSKVEGIIVVQVKVDQYGQVTEAIPGAEGTTVTDKTLWNAARNAALKAHFNQNASAPALQSGTITYVFGDVELPVEPQETPLATVKELVEHEPCGVYRIIAKYVDTYDSSKLLFSVEDDDYIIPVQLVKKDLGAEKRFRSLDLHKGDTLVIEGTLSKIDVRYEEYTGLKDAVIIEKREASKEDTDSKTIEIKPTFRGGDVNVFSVWVNSQLNYPEIAKENGVQGRVTLQFTIKADGSLQDVKVLRGVDEALDKEAVRVVSKSPKWEPGYSDGKPVDVTYTFPVIFQLR